MSDLANKFGLPPAESIDVSALSVEQCGEVVADIDARMDAFARACAEASAPARVIRKAAAERVMRHLGNIKARKLQCHAFDIVMKQNEEKEKDMAVLLGLRDHLKPDVFSATFTRTVTIKGVTDEEWAELLKVFIERRLAAEWDANGTKLNKLMELGGDVADIITKGYKPQPKGEPRLVVEMRESAVKELKR